VGIGKGERGEVAIGKRGKSEKKLLGGKRKGFREKEKSEKCHK
jgi:hypothetical protein